MTNDPIADILGDYGAFFAGQKDRLRARGIDISPSPLSFAAWTVPCGGWPTLAAGIVTPLLVWLVLLVKENPKLT